jgi:hypothetical protein
LLVGHLLLLFASRRSGLGLLALLAFAALGKVIVVDRTLTLSTVVGFAAGFAGWLFICRWRAAQRATVVLFALLGAYTLGALLPFELRAMPGAFAWVPFAQLLEGSMLANLRALTEKLLLYAGFLWLLWANGGGLISGTLALTVWVGLLELIQTMLVGRSAGISEPLWVVLSGLLLSLFLGRAARPRGV